MRREERPLAEPGAAVAGGVGEVLQHRVGVVRGHAHIVARHLHRADGGQQDAQRLLVDREHAVHRFNAVQRQKPMDLVGRRPKVRMPVGVAQVPVAHALVPAKRLRCRDSRSGWILNQVTAKVGQIAQFAACKRYERDVADEATGPAGVRRSFAPGAGSDWGAGESPSAWGATNAAVECGVQGLDRAPKRLHRAGRST